MRLIAELSPHTMSPLNQDWPSCNIRLAEASLLLRKLHHKWRVSWNLEIFAIFLMNKLIKNLFDVSVSSLSISV